MKYLLTIALLLEYTLSFAQNEHLIQYVKPIIGTDKMGHTYPGATVPFQCAAKPGNGKAFDRNDITHPEIMNGGELVFYMTSKHQ